MRMYLSSFRIGDRSEVLAERARSNPHAVIIANSLDFINGDRPCGVGTELERKDLSALGFAATEVDLRDYFGNHPGLQDRLADLPLVWVVGGNTFVLRRAMRYSGFDRWVIDHVTAREAFYAGYSAGIVLLGPTLRGLELVDSPTVIPVGYDPEIIWGGLDVLDYSIAPHFRSDHPEADAIDDVVRYFQAHRMPYRTMQDGEVITLEL